MKRVCKQIATAMVCVATLFSAQAPAQTSGPAPDLVGKAWKTRAERAAKNLAGPGLDTCDKGLERAFQKPNEVTSGAQRSFELMIEIDNQAMVAAYTYAGQYLSAFALLALPTGWLAVQKSGSKNISIVVEGSNCSFALCPEDPFMTGACK